MTDVPDNGPVRNLMQAGANMSLPLFSNLWSDDQGQDIAEYAVTLAVILVIVVGTIRVLGSNANTVFWSSTAPVQ